VLLIFDDIEANKHSTTQFGPPNLDPEFPANISEPEINGEDPSLPGTMSEGENDPLPDEMSEVECISCGGDAGDDSSLIDESKNGIKSPKIPKGINTRSMHSQPIYY
jgi:hypothetical protein